MEEKIRKYLNSHDIEIVKLGLVLAKEYNIECYTINVPGITTPGNMHSNQILPAISFSLEDTERRALLVKNQYIGIKVLSSINEYEKFVKRVEVLIRNNM